MVWRHEVYIFRKKFEQKCKERDINCANNLSAITSSFRYKAFSLNSLDKAYCCKTSYVELVRTIFFDGDC